MIHTLDKRSGSETSVEVLSVGIKISELLIISSLWLGCVAAHSVGNLKAAAAA